MVWVTIWAKVRTPSYWTFWPGTKIAALGAKLYLSAGMAWAAPIQRFSTRVRAASSDFAGSTGEPGAMVAIPLIWPPAGGGDWGCCADAAAVARARATTRIDWVRFISS